MKYLSESRTKTRERASLALNQFETQLVGYLQSNLASSTVALYKSGFNKFGSLIGNLTLNEITPKQVEQFKLHCAKSLNRIRRVSGFAP